MNLPSRTLTATARSDRQHILQIPWRFGMIYCTVILVVTILNQVHCRSLTGDLKKILLQLSHFCIDTNWLCLLLSFFPMNMKGHKSRYLLFNQWTFWEPWLYNIQMCSKFPVNRDMTHCWICSWKWNGPSRTRVSYRIHRVKWSLYEKILFFAP